MFFLETEMATHSYIFAWRIPGTEEHDGLLSMGSYRVRNYWSDLAVTADVFLKLSSCFYDPADVGNLISGSSALSKTSLNIREFTVHVLLKPGLENFEHYFTSMRWVQLCSSLSILWHCLSLGLKWKRTFSSRVATAEFSKFAGILSAALS